MIRNIDIRALDGRGLSATLYEPTRGAPEAAVVILGATAVPQRFYRHIAAWLAGRGLGVLTFDYRGVGRSRIEPITDDPATMTDWAVFDVDAAIEAAEEAFAGVPVVALCHSFGGQTLGLASGASRLRGAVAVGSQLPVLADWQGWGRLRMAVLMGGVVPITARALGYIPGWMGLSEDLPAGVMTEWATWLTSEHYLLDAHPQAARQFAELDVPVHIVALTDDDFAPLSAVRTFRGVFRGATLEVKRPQDIGRQHVGHFGLFRPACDGYWPEIEHRLATFAGLEQGRLAG